MKRFLSILLIALVGFTASAEIINFRTTAFCQKTMTSYGWTNWSSWSPSDMLITMDLTNDIITIFSPKIQKYYIYDYSNPYYDHMAQCIDYRFRDQDGDNGVMTLCQKPNGQSEIYIRFANIQWAYVVVRR